MTLEEREAQLRGVVASFQKEECQRLLEGAEREARELLQQAYQRARAHLHRRVVEERAQARARVEAAQAEQATRERMGRERLQLLILATAWPRLEKALLERWQRPEGRKAWVIHYIEEALATLPHRAWTLQHAPDLDPADQLNVLTELTRRLDEPPHLSADAGIRAGLRIQSRDAVLDATLDGLLKDRRRLEARLLALLARKGEV